VKRSRSMQEHRFTKEELALCNGKDGAPAFIASQGRVYDVSQRFVWKDGRYQAMYATGQDLEPDVSDSAQFSALGDGTILLADDEDLVRSLGERILERTGYKILTARNGLEALEIYREQNDEISLVILDLIMPVMDGKQCLDEILKVNPLAKVLIASGYSPDGATKEILEGRAKGLVNKPYDIMQMVRSVREALDAE
jgi:CheY-like chemotaxis protein/predicted heme/steroid binding protein